MLSFNDIRKGKGKIIVLDGEPYIVVSAEFLRKQQRRPVVNTILKHVKTDQTREHTFQQSDKVIEADIDRSPHQYLYMQGASYVFMNTQTYEQIELPADIAQDLARFLLEGEEVQIMVFEGNPVSLDMPIKIDRKVIDAPPGVRGDTSSNVTKEIIIEGNVHMRAPLFIKEGDVIRVDTRTGEYLERA
ncbi:MAG: elongation factor P [bacterium]|nr:elongation factor P [bacterium]